MNKHYYETQINISDVAYIMLVTSKVDIHNNRRIQNVSGEEISTDGPICIDIKIDKKSYGNVKDAVEKWFTNSWNKDYLLNKTFGVIRKFDINGYVSTMIQLHGVMPVDIKDNGSIRLYADAIEHTHFN